MRNATVVEPTSSAERGPTCAGLGSLVVVSNSKEAVLGLRRIGPTRVTSDPVRVQGALLHGSANLVDSDKRHTALTVGNAERDGQVRPVVPCEARRILDGVTWAAQPRRGEAELSAGCKECMWALFSKQIPEVHVVGAEESSEWVPPPRRDLVVEVVQVADANELSKECE